MQESNNIQANFNSYHVWDRSVRIFHWVNVICVIGLIGVGLVIFFDDAVSSGELRNQVFFSAFGLFMGYLGGMVFLKGEGVLPKEIEYYIDDISRNIYFALKA